MVDATVDATPTRVRCSVRIGACSVSLNGNRSTRVPWYLLVRSSYIYAVIFFRIFAVSAAPLGTPLGTPGTGTRCVYTHFLIT